MRKTIAIAFLGFALVVSLVFNVRLGREYCRFRKAAVYGSKMVALLQKAWSDMEEFIDDRNSAEWFLKNGDILKTEDKIDEAISDVENLASTFEKIEKVQDTYSEYLEGLKKF